MKCSPPPPHRPLINDNFYILHVHLARNVSSSFTCVSVVTSSKINTNPEADPGEGLRGLQPPPPFEEHLSLVIYFILPKFIINKIFLQKFFHFHHSTACQVMKSNVHFATCEKVLSGSDITSNMNRCDII